MPSISNDGEPKKDSPKKKRRQRRAVAVLVLDDLQEFLAHLKEVQTKEKDNPLRVYITTMATPPVKPTRPLPAGTICILVSAQALNGWHIVYHVEPIVEKAGPLSELDVLVQGSEAGSRVSTRIAQIKAEIEAAGVRVHHGRWETVSD